MSCLTALALLPTCLSLVLWGDAPAASSTTSWNPPLYAFCLEMGVQGVEPRKPAEQAQLLAELGYQGAGYSLWLDDQLADCLKSLDSRELNLFLAYTSVNLAKPDTAIDPRLPAAFARLEGRPVTIAVLLEGLAPDDPAGLLPALKILRQLGDLAAKHRLRIAIYHHVNNWTEGLPFAIEVARKADHPAVGVCFNLCHWLKIEGNRDPSDLLRQNSALLFAVTISGATVKSDTWTGGLIQPLDKGDFDNARLLGLLREIGYGGPVGLMCYGIPDESADHLARSMKVWKEWQRQWPEPPKQ